MAGKRLREVFDLLDVDGNGDTLRRLRILNTYRDFSAIFDSED